VSPTTKAQQAPLTDGDRTMELALEYDRRTCARCGVREVYFESPTMNFCEECLWNLVAEDQEELEP
jgi:hypothetical protein